MSVLHSVVSQAHPYPGRGSFQQWPSRSLAFLPAVCISTCALYPHPHSSSSSFHHTSSSGPVFALFQPDVESSAEESDGADGSDSGVSPPPAHLVLCGRLFALRRRPWLFRGGLDRAPAGGRVSGDVVSYCTFSEPTFTCCADGRALLLPCWSPDIDLVDWLHPPAAVKRTSPPSGDGPLPVGCKPSMPPHSTNHRHDCPLTPSLAVWAHTFV